MKCHFSDSSDTILAYFSASVSYYVLISLIQNRVQKQQSMQVRLHLTDARQRKEISKFWANFIGFRKTFDFARRHESKGLKATQMLSIH